MSLPDDYLAALETLARAAERYRRTTGDDMVLVGGAATAIFTDGLFQSGDFDLIAAENEAFYEAMLAEGFRKEDEVGHLLKGYYHPNHLTYGFEQVSGDLFDGNADASRLVRIRVKAAGEIVLPSIEDMIADRLGQHAIASPTDLSRLKQAQALFRLARFIDRGYLLRRISEERGDPSLLELQGQNQWN